MIATATGTVLFTNATNITDGWDQINNVNYGGRIEVEWNGAIGSTDHGLTIIASHVALSLFRYEMCRSFS